MLVEPLLRDLDLDRQRQALLEREQRPAEAVIGERARMETACELAQLLEPGVELAGRVAEQLGRGLRVRLELRLRHAEEERRRDEPLLGTVVQVALEPPALLVAGPHDPRARRLQILTCLRARDRERDEVAEGGEPHLGVGRQRVGAADRDRTPERAGDDDRRRYRRAVADPQHQLLVLALGRAPVVDPGGQAGFARVPDQRGLLDEQASAERERIDPVAVEARDDRGGVVALVAPDGRRVHLEHARALRRHGHEDALRARLRRDERRDAPKRTLLLGEPADLDELRPGVVGEPALAGLPPARSGRCRSRRDRQVRVAVAGTNLFDHAISRRPPSFVRQWPTCGLASPLLQMYASTSRNASLSSGGISVSVSSRPITSSREKPVARSQASLKRRARPASSRTQTSDCVVSASTRANSSPSSKSVDRRRVLIVPSVSVAVDFCKFLTLRL